MVSALGRHEVSEYCLVRVWDQAGVQGVGEATVTPQWSGETARGAKAIIDHLFAPAIVGLNADAIDTTLTRLDAMAVGNWFAKSALEMACWDIAGKNANQPVFELLSGASRSRVIRCRFSLGAYEPSRAAAIAAERVDAGFQTIKVKVGGRPENDIARVREVRRAIGDDVELTVDANGGWDTETAIEALGAMREFNIALAEQPTPRRDITGLAEVRRRTGLHIMADESCFDLVDAWELVRNQACDSISLYPGKQGGIRRAMAIATYAEQHGLPCTVGSNLELDIATSAMCHFVAAHPNLRVEEYPGDILGPAYHERSIACGPVAISGPFVTVPAGPGLGVEVDWQMVDECRIEP